ncbi:MAG TPA: permease-like cell division protein FtsX [Micromonosporaceae bacterium]
MRLKYVLSEVAVGLWRNVTMTIAMIITMAVSLTLLGSSVLLYLQVNKMKEVYYEKVEVTIFLKAQETTEPQKADIEAKLKQDPLVQSYDFETQQEAYERFKEIYASAKDLVDLTKPESLPESFRVKLKNPGTFAEFEASYKGMEGIDTIIDQKQLVEKVFTVLGSLQKLALIIAIVQGVAALMLVINTIQVAAYSKRREVAVMKLVGASNWFIQAPFVLEAVAAGLIGAILAYGTLILAKIYVFDGALEPLTAVLTPMTWSNVHLMLPLLAGAGALVSSVTGWIALRFYIRV